MVRTRQVIIAVALQIVLGLFDAVTSIRILTAGSAGAPPITGAEAMGGPPFWAGVMFLVLAVATLFSAYGLWAGQKWGKVICLATRAILVIFAVGDLVGTAFVGAYVFASISALYIVLSLIVVYFVLRRQPVLARA